MRTTSRRTLWVLLAGAVLTGWCSASIVSPPSAGTQTLPPRSRAAVEIVIPPIAITPVAPRTPPTTLRNPFAFGSTRTATAGAAPAGAADETPRRPASLSALDPAAAAPAAIDDGWRLIGIATSASGQTAVLAGPTGIHLARAGDRLPDGRTVLAVTDTTATLTRDPDPPLVLRLP